MLPNLRGPPKPKMSRSVAKKTVVDRREGSGSPIGEPDKGINAATPQMPLYERRGTCCQTCGARQKKMSRSAARTTHPVGACQAVAGARGFQSWMQRMSEVQQPRHGTRPRSFFPLTLIFLPSATSTHSSRRYSRTLSTIGSVSIPFLLHQVCHAASLPSTHRQVSALARCPTTRACCASNAAIAAGLCSGGCAPALGAAIPTPLASLPPLSTSMPP